MVPYDFSIDAIVLKFDRTLENTTSILLIQHSIKWLLWFCYILQQDFLLLIE